MELPEDHPLNAFPLPGGPDLPAFNQETKQETGEVINHDVYAFSNIRLSAKRVMGWMGARMDGIDISGSHAQVDAAVRDLAAYVFGCPRQRARLVYAIKSICFGDMLILREDLEIPTYVPHQVDCIMEWHSALDDGYVVSLSRKFDDPAVFVHPKGYERHVLEDKVAGREYMLLPNYCLPLGISRLLLRIIAACSPSYAGEIRHKSPTARPFLMLYDYDLDETVPYLISVDRIISFSSIRIFYHLASDDEITEFTRERPPVNVKHRFGNRPTIADDIAAVKVRRPLDGIMVDLVIDGCHSLTRRQMAYRVATNERRRKRLKSEKKATASE